MLVKFEHNSRWRRITYSLKVSARVPRLWPKFFTPSHPGNELQPGILSSLGVPTRLKISWAWLRSLLPERMGFPLNISPKTHLVLISEGHTGRTADKMAYPTPHISIAVVYRRSERSNSGGRYHLVTTRAV